MTTKNYLETENLVFKFSEKHNKFAVYKKTDLGLLFLNSSKFMTALIAAMRISMRGKFEKEINAALNS